MAFKLKLPYTVRQVAEMAGCSECSILREIHSGRLKARHKRGMQHQYFMTEADLEDWQENMLGGYVEQEN